MIKRKHTDEQLKLIAQTLSTIDISQGIEEIFSTTNVRVNESDRIKNAARSFFKLPTKLRNLAPYLEDTTDYSNPIISIETNQVVRKTEDTHYKYYTILCKDRKTNHLSRQSKRTLKINYQLFSQEELHDAYSNYRVGFSIINYYKEKGISPEDAIAKINSDDLSENTFISEVDINYSNILKQLHEYKVFEWKPEFKDYPARKREMVSEGVFGIWKDLPKNIDYGSFSRLDFITMGQLQLILSEAEPGDKIYSSVRSDVFRVIFGAKQAKHVKEALDALGILIIYRRPILGFRSSLFKPKFKSVDHIKATPYQKGRMRLFKKLIPKYTREEQSLLLNLYAKNIDSNSKGILARFRNFRIVTSLRNIKHDLDYLIMVLEAVDAHKIQAATHARYISSNMFYGINKIVTRKTDTYNQYWTYTSKQERAFQAWDKFVNTGIDFLDEEVHQSEVNFEELDFQVSMLRFRVDNEDTNLTDLELYKSRSIIGIDGFIELRAIIRHINRSEGNRDAIIDIELVKEYIQSPEEFKKIIKENNLDQREEFGRLLSFAS